MKIIIHSIDELHELVHLIAYGPAPRVVGEGTVYRGQSDGPRIADDSSPYVADLVAKAAAAGERIDGRPTALAEPYATGEPKADKPKADEPKADEPKAEMVDVDSRNIPHDERIHAGTKAKNADGTWRARRGVSPELVERVERELMGELIPRTAGERAEQREADEAAAEDAAEAVALDVQDLATCEPVDYPTLIKRAEVRALDLPGDHRSLMTAAQGFISEYGHDAFNALRAAAVPDENGVGKAVQLLSPGERRLLEACILEYAK